MNKQETLLAKPIFTVGIPVAAVDTIEKVHAKLSLKLYDYHVVVYVTSGKDMQFNTYPNDNYMDILKEFAEYANKQEGVGDINTYIISFLFDKTLWKLGTT